MTYDYLRGMAFNLSENQYVDQMDFLVEQAHAYPRSIGLHTLAVEGGRTTEPRPDNPLEPYARLLDRLFPGYSFAMETEDLRDQLYVRIPSGIEVPFTDLSSGEQEVFFILTFFLRHGIQESMVFVDEPELHLHPELARRLVRLMLAIQPRNQVWLATHNAEVIDEAGRDRTFFVTRPQPAGPATLTRASDELGAIELLRTMFGFSGYVGLARRIVFLEGTASSADRRSMVQLFPTVADELSFVPINSSENMLRTNRAALAILSETVGHSEFFLVRDRDYLGEEQVRAYEEAAGGRLFVLQRHEIENYLLNADAIADVSESITGLPIAAADVETQLLESARVCAGATLRDLVAARLARLFADRDCSIGQFMSGEEWIDPNMSWRPDILDAAKQRFTDKIAVHLGEIQAAASSAEVERVFAEAAAEVGANLATGEWRRNFPGKDVLEAYRRRAGLPSGPVLSNLIIRNLAANPGRIDPELVRIVETCIGHAIPA